MLIFLVFLLFIQYSSGCFIHIPRSGGRVYKSLYDTTCAWHENATLPPECGTTTIRNPIERYLSEWYFYGERYFRNKQTVRGWKPANGFPDTFDDFVYDSSTHNSITKILSGRQLYSVDLVSEKTVEYIMKKIESKCLNIVLTRDLPVVGFTNTIPRVENITETRLAEEANKVDLYLYARLLERFEL